MVHRTPSLTPITPRLPQRLPYLANLNIYLGKILDSILVFFDIIYDLEGNKTPLSGVYHP